LISNHFCDSVGGPEKAGVGGSIPSLATNNFNNLAIAKNIQNPRANNTRTSVYPTASFAPIGSSNLHISRAVLLPGNVLLRQLRVTKMFRNSL
jgi:hypothetical protein